ncbi:MAG: hypothetical protein ACI87E_002577 [Mariniblastus sp.]
MTSCATGKRVECRQSSERLAELRNSLLVLLGRVARNERGIRLVWGRAGKLGPGNRTGTGGFELGVIGGAIFGSGIFSGNPVRWSL